MSVEHRRPVANRLTILLPLVVLAVAAGVAQTGPGRSALRAAGLSSGQAPALELAFTQPTRLPGVVGGPSAVPVGFRLHRTAGTPTTVAWSVSLQAPGQATRQLTGGTAAVGSAGWTQVTPQVHVSCAPSPGPQRVRIAVTAGGEAIGFWTRCAGGTR